MRAEGYGGVLAVFESAIYAKSSNMSTIAFPNGIGTSLISSSIVGSINNPRTTKQRIDASTGLVVLASTPVNHRSWRGRLP